MGEDPSIAGRLGALAYRCRWRIIIAWLAVFSVAAVFAPRVTTVLKGGGYSTPSTQSDKAFSQLRRAYGDETLAFTAVFSGPDGASTLRRTAAVFDRRLRAHLRSVRPAAPVFSPDRKLVFMRIFTRPRDDLGIPLTAKVRPLLPHVPGVKGYITGPSAIFYDMEKVSDADLQHMEIVTFPIALVILLVIFGTVLASFVPVSMGPLTVTAALACIYFLGHVVDMSIFVLNTASMLGLGVAIDYSLFMVQRFREELARSGDAEQAVVRTVETAGRAIFVSALTVGIGFMGMTIFHVSMLTSLGIGGTLVVGISLLAALTLLPAVLSVLGTRVNRLAVVPKTVQVGPVWARLAQFVMKRAWPILGAVVLVVVILALPARHLHVGVPGVDILPKASSSRVGDSILRRHIGIADQSPVLIVLRSPKHFRGTATREGLRRLGGEICRQRIVYGIARTPIVNSPRAITSCKRAAQLLQGASLAVLLPKTILISVFLHADPSSARAESFVDYLRSLPAPPGVHILIGGQTAAQLDFDRFLYGRMPLAIIFVICAIFLILAIAFRSLLLPVKAIIMNGLSVLAAYGATVFVFQDGAFQSFFGFTATGSLDSIVPIFIFCVLFGISTDYEVFLLQRVREEYLLTGDNRHSVALGLEKTGRMITSAALIMVVIFGAFSFANLVVIKELGFAMAVGVLVDATLIRALLVPAAMCILGDWNWWPGVRTRLTRPRREASGPTAARAEAAP